MKNKKHKTKSAWCCACDYDITQLEAIIEEMIDELESNPNKDGSQSPNIQHWIEQKKIQLKEKFF